MHLIRSGVGSLFVNTASSLLAMLAAIVLARSLGASQFGIYANAFALISLLSVPMQFGLPPLLVREVAKYSAAGEWRYLRGLVRRAIQIVLFSGGILFVGVALVGSVLWPESDNEHRWTMGLAAILLPIIALINANGAILRGLTRTVHGLVPDKIVRSAAFLCLLWVASLTGNAIGSQTAMGLHVVAASIGLFAAIVLVRKSLPAETRHVDPQFEHARWVASAIPLGLIAAMQTLNQQLDLVVLSSFRPSEEVGIYRVVSQCGLFVAFALSAINFVTAPHFARLHAAGQIIELQKLVSTTCRIVTVMSLPVATLLIAFGAEFIGFLFGTDYASGATALAILVAGQVVNVAMGPVASLSNMTGNEGDTARCVVISAAANVAMNFMLIPPFGINGAAAATAISLAVFNIVMWILVKRRLQIDTSIFKRS